MSFLIWILTSLVAISFIGDHPYPALLIVALAGVAFGLNSFLDYQRASSPAMPATDPIPLPRVRRWVADYGWLLDVPATFLLLFPSRWMNLGFILVGLSFLLRGWSRRTILPKTPFTVPLIALLFMVPVSLWASADLSISLILLGQLIAGLNAFCAITARLHTLESLRYAAFGLVGIGIVLALATPFVIDWNTSKLLALPQVYGRFRPIIAQSLNPNVFAGALVPIIPMGLSLLLFDRRFGEPRGRLAKLGLFVGLGLIGLSLLLTQSRGGISAVVIAVVFLLILRWRWLVAVFVPVLMAIPLYVANRIGWQALIDLFFSTDAISGLAGRQEVWSRAIYALQDVPYTGIGLGIFAKALQVLYPLFLAGPDADIPHAHNLYLQVGVDLGLPGLVAYVALLVVALVCAFGTWTRARRTADGDLAAIALGLGVGLSAVMVHGLVDCVVWDAKPSILIWGLWALVACLAREPIFRRREALGE